MKKVLFLFAAASVLFASCAKNEVNQVEDSRISFQTVVGKTSTKALLTGTTYKTTDPTFGTFAFLVQKGENWSANHATAGTFIENKEVKPTGSAPTVWTTATAYYWPKQGSLTFFSYSPYNELNGVVSCTNDDKGIKVSAWDVDANQSVDVMFADKIADQTANGTNGGYTGVPTVFRHKLAQIAGFTFKTTEAYTGLEFKVTNIQVTGVNYKGKYENGAWVPDADVKDYVWYNDAAGTAFTNAGVAVAENGSGADGYILLMPQTVPAEAKVKVTYTIKGEGGAVETVSQEVDLKDITATIAENKKITYEITVGNLKQIYWAPSIVEWETENTAKPLE